MLTFPPLCVLFYFFIFFVFTVFIILFVNNQTCILGALDAELMNANIGRIHTTAHLSDNSVIMFSCARAAVIFISSCKRERLSSLLGQLRGHVKETLIFGYQILLTILARTSHTQVYDI